MKRTVQILAIVFALSFPEALLGQTYDLARLLNSNGLTVIDRKVEALAGEKSGVSFTGTPETDGYALVKGSTFSEGTIEVDIRGKDVMGQNFVGVAFHSVEGVGADVIYFRPFNFASNDPVRRSHSVQYVSLPEWDWRKLRETFPDKYESAIASPPDANGWFHARIEVKGNEITVYVDDASEPCLRVSKLNSRKSGEVGVWVGFKTSGDFANLTVR